MESRAPVTMQNGNHETPNRVSYCIDAQKSCPTTLQGNSLSSLCGGIAGGFNFLFVYFPPKGSYMTFSGSNCVSDLHAPVPARPPPQTKSRRLYPLNEPARHPYN